MDHKVVQTLARAFVQLGWRAVRFNYRGVGQSDGAWDAGRGEVDDAMDVLQALRATRMTARERQSAMERQIRDEAKKLRQDGSTDSGDFSQRA